MALRASSRSARERVKPRGMCWTTRTAAAKPAGRRGDERLQGARARRSRRRSTTHLGAAAAAGGPGCGRGRRRRARARAPGPGRGSWPPAPRRGSACSWARTLDLSTKSMAPSSRPRSVTSAPSWVSEERSSTGTGLLGHEPLEGLEAAEPRHLDVEGDDVGPQLAGLLEALLAVGGDAHHLDVRRRRRASARRALRTKAESSTTRTRIRRLPVMRAAPPASGTRWPPGSGSGRRRSVTRASDSAWPRKR